MSNIAYISPQVNTFLKKHSISLEDLFANPAGILQTYLTENQIKILDYILFMTDRHKETFISQSKIAAAIGISREWVNKTINKLCDMGLISKEFRYQDTCIYTVASFFQDFSIRDSLKRLIRSFLWLPIQLLMINNIPENQQSQKSSHYSSKDFIYLTTLNNSTVTTKRETVKQQLLSDKKQAILDDIGKIIPLTEVIRATLAVYSEDVLLTSVQLLQKSTGISNKVRYFLGICSKQHLQREQRKHVEQPQPSKPVKVWQPPQMIKIENREEEEKMLHEELAKIPFWADLMKSGYVKQFPTLSAEVPERNYKINRKEFGMKRE